MAVAARTLGVALVSLAIAASSLSPAYAGASGGVPPPDVQRVFDEDVLPFIHESAEGSGAPTIFEDADRIANITELNAFTEAYLHGSRIGPAYEPTGEWMATVLADYAAVGVVRVWFEPGDTPHITEWNGNSDLGAKLADAVGVDVVEDAETFSFYAVFGDTIGPLDENALARLPVPSTLEEFQKVRAAQLEPVVEEPATPPAGLAIGAVILALALTIGLISGARVRGRRSATGSSRADSGTGPPESR